MLQFNKIVPSPVLRRYVHTYWHISSTEAVSPLYLNRVFPDGFTDIIFNCGDPFGNEDMGNSFIAGIMKQPITVALKGSIDVIGISFKPGCARAFLGLPLHEIADTRVRLADIRKDRSREIEDLLMNTGEINKRVELIEAYLLKIAMDNTVFDTSIEKTVALIYQKSGQVSINELEFLTGFSGRQLERKFKTQVGVGPKILSRIVRFKRALTLLSNKDATLVDTALDMGYSDQAHFSREVKSFSGLTPGALIHKKPSDVVFIQE
ncbi:MAG: helix-turn-helix transcriptional regulator [bacterium]|nr:helix-turn-helix transcriptional regulator [bacterium]